MNCPTCFSKKSQFSGVIQRHIQLTHSNQMYSFMKPNGSFGFTMIFLCILVVVDFSLLLSINEFNIISYVQCDCNHMHTFNIKLCI